MRVVSGTEGTTLVFRFGDLCETTLGIGNTQLRLAIADREIAARDGLDYTPPVLQPVDLLTLPRTEAVGESGVPKPIEVGSEGKPMETLGVYVGAARYEFSFTLSQTASEIILPHAGDLITAFLDDVYCGTFVGDGGPLAIPLPENILLGAHTLRLRTEIWGHSNFHDERWQSARLGSLRGVWGIPAINGVELRGEWRFAPQAEAFPNTTAKYEAIQGTVAAKGGESKRVTFDLSTLPDRSQGVLLTLSGSDVWGRIELGERVVGRYLFGPSLPVALTGGPEDRFFLPREYLAKDNTLSLVTHGAGDGGAITAATLEVFTNAAS
ncbi:MAG: hypothetical protein EON58_18480 [Alphaproteobacteria bacterium]|nr:MAG: hypothetical protein EON58_18480 [Alphaproteobacteria bacterium]